MRSKEHNNLDAVTLFTSCLTNFGMSTWERLKNRTLAIEAEAGGLCEQNAWSGLISVFALTNVLGRPVFSVYPKTGGMQSNAVRGFFHGIISPFVAGSVQQTPVYIMWEVFHVSRASNWKNILLLIRLLFTFHVSNAAVERFFSCLGRVKTAQRSSLCQATLQNTLRILVSGKPLDSYDPQAATCAWEKAKNRRPNQRQRKKRGKKRHYGIKDISIFD